VLSPQYEIELSQKERQRIEGLLRSGKTEPRLAKRAAMILLADDGFNNQQMADRIGTSRNSVQTWRKRLAVFEGPSAGPGPAADPLGRLEALLDLRRSGRPPVFSPSGPSHGRGRGLSHG